MPHPAGGNSISKDLFNRLASSLGPLFLCRRVQRGALDPEGAPRWTQPDQDDTLIPDIFCKRISGLDTTD